MVVGGGGGGARWCFCVVGRPGGPRGGVARCVDVSGKQGSHSDQTVVFSLFNCELFSI